MASPPATAQHTPPPGLRTTSIRAIPSSLAIKSTPTIPQPSDSYEPLIKTVLRHRLARNIFLQSGLLTWATITLATIWQQGAPTNAGHVLLAPLRPLNLIASFAVWIFVALPIIVLRKMLLISTRTVATSPATSLSTALNKPSIRRAFLVYTISALALVLIHVTISNAIESSDPKLRLFVKSKKHPHYLNGRLLFLLMSQIALAVSYGIRNIMLDRFSFKWSIAAQKSEFGLGITLVDVVRSVIVASVLSCLALPVTATIFTFARLLLPIIYKFPLVSPLLRPFTAHFLRGPWIILLPLRHVDLIRRALQLGFVSFFIWETSDTLFDVNVARQIPVAALTADPNQTLVSGLSSADPSFKFFAYSELCTLAEDTSTAAIAQRSALFSDQKYTPTLWSRFIRESLLVLGKDYQHFLRRGTPETPVITPPAVAPAIDFSSIASSSVSVQRRKIFKSEGEVSIKTTTHPAVSNSTISRVHDTSVKNVEVPEIFRSVEAKVIPQTKKPEVNQVVENAKGTMEITKRRINEFVCGAYKKNVPPVVANYLQSWLAWWRHDRTDKIVEKCLPSRELDIIIIEVVSRLTCASLTEDRYGVVQRDIPRILEAFTSFLSAVEEYQVQVNSLYVAPKADERLTPKELQERETLRYEVEKGGEVLGAMADGLKEGVARIVRTFGDRLLAFKFPPRTAQKLQGFLDYC